MVSLRLPLGALVVLVAGLGVARAAYEPPTPREIPDALREATARDELAKLEARRDDLLDERRKFRAALDRNAASCRGIRSDDGPSRARCAGEFEELKKWKLRYEEAVRTFDDFLTLRERALAGAAAPGRAGSPPPGTWASRRMPSDLAGLEAEYARAKRDPALLVRIAWLMYDLAPDDPGVLAKVHAALLQSQDPADRALAESAWAKKQDLEAGGRSGPGPGGGRLTPFPPGGPTDPTRAPAVPQVGTGPGALDQLKNAHRGQQPPFATEPGKPLAPVPEVGAGTPAGPGPGPGAAGPAPASPVPLPRPPPAAPGTTAPGPEDRARVQRERSLLEARGRQLVREKVQLDREARSPAREAALQVVAEKKKAQEDAVRLLDLSFDGADEGPAPTRPAPARSGKLR